MDSHHLKGRPGVAVGVGGALWLRCDEMWRYLLLCIIRSTGDYTLYPQRVDTPPSFLRGAYSGLGAKINILSAPTNTPPSFLWVHVCFSLQLIIQIRFEMQSYTLSGLFGAPPLRLPPFPLVASRRRH